MHGMYGVGLLFENQMGHVAHIQITGSSEDVQGHRLLSHECRTYAELEHCVNLLRKDLEDILRDGKRKFAQPRPPLLG